MTHLSGMHIAYRSSSGKWGTTTNKNKVPAPSRASLAMAGKSAFRAKSATATAKQQNPTKNNSHFNADEHALAIVPQEQNDNNDLLLWIVAYGFRTEDQFRALYNRLENCGKITSRCGGLSTLGERRKNNDNDGKNWVALRYESSLLAHKALCQNGAFLNVGGSTIIIGVLPLAGSDAIARLGINFSGATTLSPLESFPKLRNSQFASDAQKLITESDIMLNDGEKEGAADEDDAITSQLDSLCGKVLAWFFMLDVQN